MTAEQFGGGPNDALPSSAEVLAKIYAERGPIMPPTYDQTRAMERVRRATDGARSPDKESPHPEAAVNPLPRLTLFPLAILTPCYSSPLPRAQ